MFETMKAKWFRIVIIRKFSLQMMEDTMDEILDNEELEEEAQEEIDKVLFEVTAGK